MYLLFLSNLVTSIIMFPKTMYFELTTKLGKLTFFICWNHAFELMICKAPFTLFCAATKNISKNDIQTVSVGATRVFKIVHGYQWLYMFILGYTWLYVVIRGYTWFICGFFVVIRG